jgi:ABC-type uncharacterized transport system involved in gliding motility auxiliary subunit
VVVETNPRGVTVQKLVSTSAQAWAETDIQSVKNNQVKLDAQVDLPGPVPLAGVGENLENKGRVVAIGNASFAANSGVNLPSTANLDFAVNSIDWAARQESLINLTPKPTKNRLMLPPAVVPINLVLLVSVFIIPGLALAAGVVVFFQRRSRG